MLPVLLESWNRVQQKLRARAGDAAHGEWLSKLQPLSMERGTIYLEAETRFCADRVRTLFRPLLQEILSEEIGTQVLVELQTREVERFDQLEVGPNRPVVDDSNRLAWLVLQNLRSGKELPASLFFFHGESGVGKTFLLRWFREETERRLRWFDQPKLFQAFQAAHQEKRVAGLEDELARSEALVIDELHRMAGKKKFQRFLMRVLQRREEEDRVTIMASRWHPHEIREIEPGLATRLLAGFVVGIDRPGPLGRLRYLRALEGSPSRNGRAGAVEALARQCEGTWPEIRSAWSRTRPGQPASRYLELIDPSKVFSRARDRVVEAFGVSAEALVSKCQGRALSRARKVLALLCLEHGLSGGEVGRFLGGRTRASVSYMVRTLQTEMAKSETLRRTVEALL